MAINKASEAIAETSRKKDTTVFQSLRRQFLRSRSVKPKPARVLRVANRRIPDSAVRPEVFGESYNAKISAQLTTDQHLKIVPLWHFHSIALFLALVLTTVLSMVALVDSVNPDDPEFSALAPENSIHFFFATIPPGFVPFVFFFGLVALALMVNGLRKSVRAITFDLEKNLCTIEKLWLFGFFSHADKPVIISEIAALQLTSYTDKEAATRYTHQTGKKQRWCSDKPTKEYELNLVVLDGSRINIVNHRYKRGILRDATTLCRWLNDNANSDINISGLHDI